MRRPGASAETVPLTVVSGASAGYFRCIDRFLASALRHRLPQRHRVIVYDLGLTAGQRRELERLHPWCEWRAFDYSRHPPHVRLEAGHYAWKPIIVADLLEELGNQVLWLDSATLLHANLDEVRAALTRHGTYTLAGQAPIGERCDPLTLAALSPPPEILDRPERVAGVVGFDARHPVAAGLARTWRQHALTKSLIAPRQPRLRQHNPEQALLSILLLSAELRGELTLNAGEIDISSTRPARWLSSRHKVSDRLPRRADLPMRLASGFYKRLDRLYLRWRRSVVPLIDGLLRLPHDHYQVWLRRGNEAPVRLTAPWDVYWADPFVWHSEGVAWVLVEEYQYRQSRGRLLALALDERMRISRQTVPLAFAHHVSFPFLLEEAGALYMIPETSHGRCVDLYLCENFPDQWRRVARLLSDVDAADSVVFRHDRRWWLVTSLRDGGEERRYLAIFWSADLHSGDWTAHPINAQRRYQGAGPEYLRAAGPIVRHDGKWLRPVQVNPHFYGESMAVMQIDLLDEHNFIESPCQSDHPFGEIARTLPAHHVSQHGNLLAWDIRDRVDWSGLLRVSPRAKTPA